MKVAPYRIRGVAVIAAFLLTAMAGPTTLWAAEKSPLGHSATDDAWIRTVDLVRTGEFDAAKQASEKLPEGVLTKKVRAWLEEYAAAQTRRKEMNRADFEMYVRYAKERHERKEYDLALQKALQAADNLDNRDELLNEPWLQVVVNDALDEGSRLRKNGEWEEAWRIYYYLGLLFERESRYEKLERECITHLRLDRMFEEDSKWDEPIRNITWLMAERALEQVDRLYYDESPPFGAMAKSGLEQLLLLSRSESARQTFDGLENEVDRRAFQDRVQFKLDQISAAREVDRRTAIQCLRRALDINRATVDLPENLVISEMMRGAFEPLDDFTDVIWPIEMTEFTKHTKGDFIGVGISIAMNRSDEVEVITPLAFGPAYRKGIHAGDVITKVNGQSLKGVSLTKSVEIITGPKGTDVTLTIRRGDKEMDFTLRRELIVIETVTGIERIPDDPENWNYWIDRDSGIAYVRVGSFARNTVKILKGVISELHQEGLKGLILDLRGNPGGLLDSAEEMTSLFLPKDSDIHSIRGRNPRDNKHCVTRGDGPFTDVPLAVLVDESSASASEIVSGAIRDNHRGTVVGARTFGKFSVQNLVAINHMPQAALKITTARYYLPSGASLHRDDDSPTWGVEPDIPVRLVSKEKLKFLRLQRSRDLLGPTNDEAGDDEAEAQGEAGEASDDEDAKAPASQGDEAADGDAQEGTAEPTAETDEAAVDEADAEDDKDKLPPLEQPDENNRPEADPQLDTALLLMRVALLGEAYPTLATANLLPKPEPRPE